MIDLTKLIFTIVILFVIVAGLTFGLLVIAEEEKTREENKK